MSCWPAPELPMSEGSAGVSTAVLGGNPNLGRLQVGLLAGGVLLFLIGLYSHVVPRWLQDLWDDPNYSHVFIVPIISGFVLWQRRRDLAVQPTPGSGYGLPFLLGGVGALTLGDIADETFLMRTSLIVIVIGLVL